MADIAKVSGIALSSVAKVMGIAGAKVMGLAWPSGSGPTELIISPPDENHEGRWIAGAWFNAALRMDCGYFDPGMHYNCWAYFENVTIPPGATINSAFLTLIFRFPVESTTTLYQIIYAVAADNPALPTSHTDFATLTTAHAHWDIPYATITGWSDNTPKDSVDISAVIKEIVDLAGWESGNSLLLTMKDDGAGSQGIKWNNAQSVKCVLTIEYS